MQFSRINPLTGAVASSATAMKATDMPAIAERAAAHGLRVARQIHSGICHIKGPTVHDEAQMPFGGVGASGYGRFGGKAGIEEFTVLRWITRETQPEHFPI